MDTLHFHYINSIFPRSKFWDASISWKNKYSNLETYERKKVLGIPVPVLFTDGWHLVQSIYLTCLFLSIVLYKPFTPYMIEDFLILRFVFGFFFVLFYDYLLKKK